MVMPYLFSRFSRPNPESDEPPSTQKDLDALPWEPPCSATEQSKVYELVWEWQHKSWGNKEDALNAHQKEYFRWFLKRLADDVFSFDKSLYETGELLKGAEGWAEEELEVIPCLSDVAIELRRTRKAAGHICD